MPGSKQQSLPLPRLFKASTLTTPPHTYDYYESPQERKTRERALAPLVQMLNALVDTNSPWHVGALLCALDERIKTFK